MGLKRNNSSIDFFTFSTEMPFTTCIYSSQVPAASFHGGDVRKEEEPDSFGDAM